MAGLGIMTSTASTRPAPSARGMSCCEITRLQHERELRAHLRLLVLREDVDDAVDGLHGASWCAGSRTPGGRSRRRPAPPRSSRGRAFRRSARCRDPGAARACSASREAVRVGEDLALVDDAALVLVHELDRVLDRDDVLVALAVDLVDHGRERGRLAAAGRAGDQHEAARQLGQLVDRPAAGRARRAAASE